MLYGDQMLRPTYVWVVLLLCTVDVEAWRLCSSGIVCECIYVLIGEEIRVCVKKELCMFPRCFCFEVLWTAEHLHCTQAEYTMMVSRSRYARFIVFVVCSGFMF